MPDYHHDLLFGVSIPPNARDHEAILATAELADSLGGRSIGIQDHPYQAGLLDAWTLLSDGRRSGSELSGGFAFLRFQALFSPGGRKLAR